MPIQLTTVFAVGDFDTDDYQHVRVVSFTLHSVQNFIEVECQYGNTVNGVWVGGTKAPEVHKIEGADYAAMVAKLPQGGETIYQAAGREIYQWLIDQGKYVGTLV